MNRLFFASIFTLAGIIVSGCDGGLLANSRIPAAKIGETSWRDLTVSAGPHD